MMCLHGFTVQHTWQVVETWKGDNAKATFTPSFFFLSYFGLIFFLVFCDLRQVHRYLIAVNCLLLVSQLLGQLCSMGDKRRRIASVTVHGDSCTEKTTTPITSHGGGIDAQYIEIGTTEGGNVWCGAEWPTTSTKYHGCVWCPTHWVTLSVQLNLCRHPLPPLLPNHFFPSIS